MQLNEEIRMRLHRAWSAYTAGEIGKADVNRVYLYLADEAEARAAVIVPDTREAAFEHYSALGEAKAWRVCAGVDESAAREVEAAA